MSNVVPIETADVRGFLHRPTAPSGTGLILTHGAGGNCGGSLLVAVAAAFCAAGLHVLRCDLPFRRRRPFGPPSRGSAAADRDGLRSAVMTIRGFVSGPVALGGQSYGGRQATILAADDLGLAAMLLLFSYPLHPPGKPEQLRTEHFPRLAVPSVFVHGAADPFGSIEEMRSAISLIPARTSLMPIEKAGHDLRRGRFALEPILSVSLALLSSGGTPAMMDGTVHPTRPRNPCEIADIPGRRRR